MSKSSESMDVGSNSELESDEKCFSKRQQPPHESEIISSMDVDMPRPIGSASGDAFSSKCESEKETEADEMKKCADNTELSHSIEATKDTCSAEVLSCEKTEGTLKDEEGAIESNYSVNDEESFPDHHEQSLEANSVPENSKDNIAICECDPVLPQIADLDSNAPCQTCHSEVKHPKDAEINILSDEDMQSGDISQVSLSSAACSTRLEMKTDSSDAKTVDFEIDDSKEKNCNSEATIDVSEIKTDDLITTSEDKLSSEVAEEEEEEEEDDDSELMGFCFNKDGELRDKDGKRFEFRHTENEKKNQKRYEKLGEKITEYVYKLLETECSLKRHYIPIDAKDEEKSFFFASERAFTTTDRLLVLIHGSGVVRAGQWARRIIINDNLNDGSQIPYIKKAFQEGYEVIVLNTNLNRGSSDVTIRGSEDAEKHALYVWENFIEKEAKAKHIAIVAHSYGGIVTVELACERWPSFMKQVFAIAFTDSIHSIRYSDATRDIAKFFEQHAQNWVSSSLPLDKPVESWSYRAGGDAPQVSAGDSRHEWTSSKSINSIFTFLNKHYRERSTPSRCQTC